MLRVIPKAVANGGVDVLQKEQLRFPQGDVSGPFQSSQEDYVSYQLGAFKETDLASSGVPHLPWEVSWEKDSLVPQTCFLKGWALTA